MLDVHPPHHAANTWRDFFIHIATIVVGLLIAVGLEQTVEYFHHRHEVADTREALRLERDQNRRLFVRYVQDFHWETALLENNMLVFDYLQQHPGTPQEKLPGVLNWRWARAAFTHVAWDTAQQTSITALMPQKEVSEDARLYDNLQRTSTSDEQTWDAINEARKYTFHDSDPSRLTPIQVEQEIDLLKTAMMKHYAFGITMGHFPGAFPDFPYSINDADIEQLEHYPDAEKLKSLATARSFTDNRLKAAGYAPRTMTPDGWVAVSPDAKKN